MTPETMLYRTLTRIFYQSTSLEEAKRWAEDAMIQIDGDPFGEREAADNQRELVFSFNQSMEAKESA